MLAAAAVPAIFDPHSGDVFNLPKFTVVVIIALAVAGLWVISAVHERRSPFWRNGLQWVLAAIVVWGLVSALAGVDTHVSLLGNYGSYDGWYSAAAFAVITMAAAEALEASDVRRTLGAAAFCGGTVVAVYGLIQLHDTELGGGKWDFIKWNLGSFSNDIFSTFGNPNHLGGYMAMVLPVALVVGLSARRWPWKVLTLVFVLAILAELLRTSARGAWVGALAALVALALYLAPEIRRRPAQWFGGGAVVVVLAVVLMATKGRHFLGHPLSTLFQSGGDTSVGQRFQMWKAAGQIVLNHPVTGIGPDNFALVYPQYQSAKWVAGLGPNYLVNGAHDIFMNFLADQGFIGVLLFIALLVFAGLRSVGAWRRLRRTERDESAAASARDEARERRLLLAAASASITAYIVQAIFNVQQIGLEVVFWVALGLVLVLANAAGVPDTLSPAALVRVPAAEAGEAAALGGVPGAPGRAARPRPRPSWAGGRRQEVPWATLAVGTVVTGVVVFLAVLADAPYRADHDYWAAYKSLGLTGTTSAHASKAPTQVTQTFFTDMKHAIALNPAEPTYPFQEANVLTSISEHSTTSSQRLTYMTEAHSLFVSAADAEPLWAPYQSALAQADVEMANLQPAQATTYLADARASAEKAVADNPRDSAYHALLASIVADQKKAATAAAKASAAAHAKSSPAKRAKAKGSVKPAKR
jgi:putative inorganic carbon (HCO3(-)) transporter